MRVTPLGTETAVRPAPSPGGLECGAARAVAQERRKSAEAHEKSPRREARGN